MSHEKLTSTGTPYVNAVSFYYATDVLFNRISERSLYDLKEQTQEQGTDDFDKFSITIDDKEFIIGLLLEVIETLFPNLARYSYNVEEPIIGRNEDYTPISQGAIKIQAFFLKIKDNANYSEDFLKRVDKNLEDAIIKSVLVRWFASQNKNDFAGKFMSELNTHLVNLDACSFYLKLPVIS